MIYDPHPGVVCLCDHDAIFRQHVRYSYPRDRWVPEAMDPYRVHGGGYSIRTCGNPQCEAAALKGCREQIIDDHVLLPGWCPPSGLSVEQMAGLELEVVS